MNSLIADYQNGEHIPHLHMAYMFDNDEKEFEALALDYLKLVDGMVLYGTPIPTIKEVVEQVTKNVDIYCRLYPDKVAEYANKYVLWGEKLYNLLRVNSCKHAAFVMFQEDSLTAAGLMYRRLKRMHEQHRPQPPLTKMASDSCQIMEKAERYYTNPQYELHEEIFAGAITFELMEHILIKELSYAERHQIASMIYGRRKVPDKLSMIYEVIENAIPPHNEQQVVEPSLFDYSARISASFFN